MMKNVFFFILKALLVLKIFKLLFWRFGHVEKKADQKDKANFEIHGVKAWLTNNCNTYRSVSHELKVTGQWNLVS